MSEYVDYLKTLIARGGEVGLSAQVELRKFSEDQPRDSHGRFGSTDGGGSSSSGSSRESSSASRASAPSSGEREFNLPGPVGLPGREPFGHAFQREESALRLEEAMRPDYPQIVAERSAGSPAEKLDRISNGEKINVTREEAVEILKMAAEAPKGTYDKTDISNMHVEGGSFFDRPSFGFSRNDMPQIPDKPEGLQEKWVQFLVDSGIAHRPELVDPNSLAPTQREMGLEKTAQIMQGILDAKLTPEQLNEKYPEQGRVIVSNDGQVMDGHHRISGYAGAQMADPSIVAPIMRVDASASDLLNMMSSFCAANGVKLVGLGQDSGSTEMPKFLKGGDVEGHKQRLADFTAALALKSRLRQEGHHVY
jgi:hypothetical protein